MKPANPVKKSRFIDRVSVYGLEFAVAMIAVLISASVLAFATYALFGYIANKDVSMSAGYFALWSSASTIVWVPIALLFYLRSRAYIAAHPDVTSNPVQRTFTVIFQVVTIITIIGFAFGAVFATLTGLAQPENTGKLLVGTAVPSLISALLFGGILVSFFRQPVVTRRAFALVFALVSLAIVVPTIITSIVSLRNENMDRMRSQDLTYIMRAVNSYAYDKRTTPSKLSDVQSQIDSEKTKERLGDYDYRKVDSRRFELCAPFASDTENHTKPQGRSSSESTYTSYGSFSRHTDGRECFKLRTMYGSTYDDPLLKNER